MGSFVPLTALTGHIVGTAVLQAGAADGVATVLSIFFSLNILLGCFNLIPFPPLDGYGVLGLFTTENRRAAAAGIAREDGRFLDHRAGNRLAAFRPRLPAALRCRDRLFYPDTLLTFLLNPDRVDPVSYR